MTRNLTLNLSARQFGNLTALFSLFALASCITVNVNFPESAVQRAADDFVRDLYKGSKAVADNNTAGTASKEADTVKNAVKKSGKKGKVPAAEAKDTKEPTTWRFELISSAFAQEINTSTPKANAIKDRMRARVNEITSWKNKSVVCETSDGMLRLKDAGKAGAAASDVSRLVATENRDRDELYAEIQDANKIQDRNQTRIRKFFAGAFKSNSPSSGICAD